MHEDDYPRERRRERWDAPGEGRFLTCSCYGNQAFLRSQRACKWFVDALTHAKERQGFLLWSWCVMPTHFHLLIFPRRDDPRVSAILRGVKQSVARHAVKWVRENTPEYLPRMMDTQPSGRVTTRFWQRNGGYDRNMRTGRSVWEVIRYIHNNPVVDGLASHAAAWPWSSAREFEKRGSGPIPIDWDTIPRE